MAGHTAINIAGTPRRINDKIINVTHINAGGAAVLDVPAFIADQRYILEKAVARVQTLAAANTCNVAAKRVASGTAITDANTLLTTAVNIGDTSSDFTVDVNEELTVNTSNNIIEPGETVAWDFSADTSTMAGFIGVLYLKAYNG